MAAKEIYDYVDTVSADVDQTLSVSPQAVLTETGSKNDIVHLMDDDSEERVSLGGSGNFSFYIVLRYDLLSESDSGTVIDFFFDSAKGDGRVSSFKFSHPDGHTYVVRFDTDMQRAIDPVNHSIKQVRLKVLGRIAD